MSLGVCPSVRPAILVFGNYVHGSDFFQTQWECFLGLGETQHVLNFSPAMAKPWGGGVEMLGVRLSFRVSVRPSQSLLT